MKKIYNKDYDMNLLKNIKSKYILIIVLENLSKYIAMKLIKYNKNLQYKFNISLNDYKNNYEQIEMEIIPINKKDKNKFINININKSYYHIYFNDDKKETHRNYFTKYENIKKIKVILDGEIKSFKRLFYKCKCIKKVTFINFRRKDIKDMSYMFKDCLKLEEINFNNFCTNNVTNMSDMFSWCISLKALNLNKFNTNNVTNMSNMFSNCRLLFELNFNNFNTNNVVNMSFMFYECISLKELNLNNFNTKKVTDMKYMFSNCYSLKELNINNFNTNNVTNMSHMFNSCYSLKELNLNHFNTNKVINMSFMFDHCRKLKILYFDNLKINEETKNENMFFYDCEKIIKKSKMKILINILNNSLIRIILAIFAISILLQIIFNFYKNN